jgi:lipoyl(octanoyl) transferase
MKMSEPFLVRTWWGYEYVTIWQAMQRFTQQRTSQTCDEIWLAEHPPVFTVGQRATFEDIIQKDMTIPIIHTDRGGRVTYHGPGQLLIYPLLNLKNLGCNLRELVSALEDTLIRLLQCYGVIGYAKREAPGVYIQEKKVASIGLRIRQGYCYHGIAVNIDMDLTPFQSIYPCGFKELAMTQLVDWIGPVSRDKIAEQFLVYWLQQPFYHP